MSQDMAWCVAIVAFVVCFALICWWVCWDTDRQYAKHNEEMDRIYKESRQ